VQYQTLAFNQTKWGPTLRLKEGQLYKIDVTNVDIPEGTSVHWHGQRMANASWADGVTDLTQAAIPPGATFSYRFVAEPAGTYWYHSHTGDQYGDGLRGALIVEGDDGLADMWVQQHRRAGARSCRGWPIAQVQRW
jgi:FtsP/CotA-like multicopper oxidase with cupredoxin domain